MADGVWRGDWARRCVESGRQRLELAYPIMFAGSAEAAGYVTGPRASRRRRRAFAWARCRTLPWGSAGQGSRVWEVRGSRAKSSGNDPSLSRLAGGGESGESRVIGEVVLEHTILKGAEAAYARTDSLERRAGC